MRENSCQPSDIVIQNSFFLFIQQPIVIDNHRDKNIMVLSSWTEQRPTITSNWMLKTNINAFKSIYHGLRATFPTGTAAENCCNRGISCFLGLWRDTGTFSATDIFLLYISRIKETSSPKGSVQKLPQTTSPCSWSLLIFPNVLCLGPSCWGGYQQENTAKVLCDPTHATDKHNTICGEQARRCWFLPCFARAFYLAEFHLRHTTHCPHAKHLPPCIYHRQFSANILLLLADRR